MQMNGIDVSGYQGKIDFNVVKRKYDFVIIKSGYSTKTVDTWETNYKNAKAAGMKIGAYWYTYAETIEEAKREAQAFVRALEGKTLDFPVFVDIEEPEMFKRGKQFCTDVARAFINTLNGNDYYCGIYGSAYWITNFIDKTIRVNVPMWIADYRGSCGYEGAGIWQWGKSIVDGVENECDGDIAYTDYSDMIIKNGLNGYPKPDDTTNEKLKQAETLARDLYLLLKQINDSNS